MMQQSGGCWLSQPQRFTRLTHLWFQAGTMYSNRVGGVYEPTENWRDWMAPHRSGKMSSNWGHGGHTYIYNLYRYYIYYWKYEATVGWL